MKRKLLEFIGLLLFTYITLSISLTLSGMLAGNFLLASPATKVIEFVMEACLYSLLQIFCLDTLKGVNNLKRVWKTFVLMLFTTTVLLSIITFIDINLGHSNRVLTILFVYLTSGFIVGSIESNQFSNRFSLSKLGWMSAVGLGWFMAGGGAFVILLLFLPIQN